jgi:hypothetical protein
MSFFHLHPSPSPAAASAWAIYQQLDRSQWLTPAQIERNQLAALDALLGHCAWHIPYYRRLLREVGIPSTAKTAAEAAPTVIGRCGAAPITPITWDEFRPSSPGRSSWKWSEHGDLKPEARSTPDPCLPAAPDLHSTRLVLTGDNP